MSDGRKATAADAARAIIDLIDGMGGARTRTTGGRINRKPVRSGRGDNDTRRGRGGRGGGGGGGGSGGQREVRDQNPMTQRHSLIVGGVAGSPKELVKGPNGYVLGVVGGVVDFYPLSAFGLPTPEEPESQLYVVIDGVTHFLSYQGEGLYYDEAGEGADQVYTSFHVVDVGLVLRDDGDHSKRLRFQLANISPGETRTLSAPDKDGVIATTDDITPHPTPPVETVADTATVDLTLTGTELTADVVPGGIDHQSLAGSGTNDHAAIDAHIADSGIHGGGGGGGAVGSVGDTETVNLTITGDILTADVLAAGIDHDALASVGTNDHAAIDAAIADLAAHIADVTNPHTVTKDQVGLGNVDNTSDLDKPISTATQAALDLKADDADLTAHTGDTNNPHAVTKSQVGLGSVDNTSDMDKPVSTAQQAAIDAIPAGPRGYGVTVSAPFTFSANTTVADPGDGVIRLNNATQRSATTLVIDNVDADGLSSGFILTPWLSSTSAIRGYARIEHRDDPSRYLVLGGLFESTPEAGFLTVPVGGFGWSADSPFSEGDPVQITVIAVGDKGDPGAQGDPGPAGADASLDDLETIITSTNGPVTNNSTSTWVEHLFTTAVLPAGTWEIVLDYTGVYMADSSSGTMNMECRVSSPMVTSPVGQAVNAGIRLTLSGVGKANVVSDGSTAIRFAAEFKRVAHGSFTETVRATSATIVANCKKVA